MYFSKLLVLRNEGDKGRLVLFGLGVDNQVYYTHPMDPPDPAGWISIGGSLLSLDGSENGLGALEIFGRGTEDDQAVWHSWQDKSSENGWHEWVSLGHPDR